MGKALEQTDLNKTIKVGDSVDIFVDINKAEEDAEGKRIFYGRASDETLDLDEQKVASSAIQKSLSYFLKYGKFDWDHKSKNDPKFIIGQPLAAEIKNKEFFVKGEMFKGIPVADDTWKLMKAGAKLGFSLTGKIHGITQELDKALNKSVPKISKLILTGIAVTPAPKNYNTYCQPWTEFAKSLSWEKDASELSETEIREEVEKSMNTATGAAQIGQSLENKVTTTTYGDGKENKKKKKGRATEMVEKLAKSLEEFNKGVGDLVKAMDRYDEEDKENSKKEAGMAPDVEEEIKEPSKKKEKKAKKKEDETEEEDVEKSENAEDEEKKEEAEEEGKEEASPAETKTEEVPAEKPAEEAAEEKPESIAKAFEVTPVLKHIGKELEDVSTLSKSLLEANQAMVDVIKNQGELIKSLETRISEIEEMPIPHKSVQGHILRKGIGGQGNMHEMNSDSMEDGITLEKAIGKEIPIMALIKKELGMPQNS